MQLFVSFFVTRQQHSWQSHSALCTHERIDASRQEAGRHTPGTRAWGSEQAEFIPGSFPPAGVRAPWASWFLILTVGVVASSRAVCEVQ